jgi:cytosol alanyl aminopeptidase
MASSNAWLAGALSLLASGCSTAPPPPPAPSSPPPVRAQPAPASPSPETAADQPIFRLPGDVRPEQEAVELEVVPDREGFTGRVAIQLRFLAKRDDLWVSSRGLKFSEGKLELPGETLPVRVEPDDGIGAAHVVLPHAVGPGTATLRLAFAGTYNLHLTGLYRVKAAGRFYAFTQFEAIDARRAFPCFDEPAFKIRWDVTVTVRAGDVAVSNTDVLNETPGAGGLKRVTFRTTRPLPSYLVALAVGDFDVVRAPELQPNEIRHRPLQLRGLATKGRGAELEQALRAGAELLVMLERWFGMEYPYEKLDFIAVPDFQYGAMENAGAITFSELTLLVDPRNASEDQKQWVAVDLAHELAHQWFGDLVTMAWWDDLWLNESFASFMEEEIVSAWNPGLRYDLVFLGRLQAAMGTDGLSHTKPIRPNIVFEADIFDADFDIVYAKGSAVIGMFEQFLGREAFRSAIRSYLQSHADGNATLGDLLSALSTHVTTVGPAFRSFIEQPGVPLLAGELSCKDGKAALELRQSRFRPLGSEAQDSQWKVPVCARAEGASEAVCTMLSEPEGSLPLGKGRCPRWVALNPKAAGYYRFVLPPKQLQALLAAQKQALNAAERLSLEGNLVASFEAGGLDAAAVVAGLEHFAADEEPAVSMAPADFLREARIHVVSPEVRPQLEAYARQLYGPILKRLGWEVKQGESARVRSFRGFLVSFLARVAMDDDVRARAAGLAQLYLGADGKLHPDAVDANLVLAALRASALLGDAQLFDVMLDRLETAEAAPVRANLLVGLASFRDSSLAARARALTFDPRLRTDERTLILLLQLGTLETHADAWSWMQAHISELASTLPFARLNNLLESSAGCSPADATAMEALRGAVQPRVGTYSLDKTVEVTRLCAALVAAQRPKADAFFRKAPAPGRVPSRLKTAL